MIHGRKPEDGFSRVAALFVYDALDAYVFSQELNVNSEFFCEFSKFFKLAGRMHF